MLVSAVQQHESSICVCVYIYISPLSWASLPSPIPPLEVITGLPVLYSNFSPTIHFTHNFTHTFYTQYIFTHNIFTQIHILMLLSPFIPLPPSPSVHSYLLKKLQIVKCFIKVIHIVTVSCIIHFFCKCRLLSGILFLLSEELPSVFLVVQICVFPHPSPFFFADVLSTF